MTPSVASTIFAILVAVTNWHYMRSVVSERSTYKLDIAGSALTILFCLGAIFFIGRALYQLVRKFLSQGVIVPQHIRLVDWSPCLFLLPLLLRVSGGFTESTTHGDRISIQWGYGSDSSIYALLFSVFVIALFQVYSNLSRFDTTTTIA
jgi:hypothetical protein